MEPIATEEESRDLGDDDTQVLALLDEYLDALSRGDEAAREALLAEHPQLQPYVGCMDVLERMAVAPVRPLGGNGADGATLIMSSADAERLARQVLDEDFPRTFGRYELLGELGRGGMGIVYQARHLDLNRIVALKMVRSQQLASQEELRRFQAEARAAARLRHPHIVSIHDINQVGNQHYFTMDYVEGSSLASLTARGPLDPDVAAACLAHVARAVHYLHAHGIVHRDLKPHNILIDPQGRPYVTDFGLAKIHGPDSTETQSGAILGTPSYMAPEQAAGKHRLVSARSDIWSLGAILYEMLTGRPPFREDNYVDTLLQVMEGEPTLPDRINKGVPSELQWVCMKCLTKEPTARYTTADELADDLERYTRGEVTLARPSGYLGTMVRWARREPAFAVRLALLLMAALIVHLRLLTAPDSLPNYPLLMGVFSLWGLGGYGLQQLLNRPRTAEFARYAWSLLDIALFTVILIAAHHPRGSLLIGYPFFVAASGLLFRVRLVIMATAASVLSYLTLLWFCPEEVPPVHYVAVFVCTLITLGLIVGIQVRRVRALSRFYDRPTSW